MSKKQLPVAPAGRPCARVTCETLPSALDRWDGGIKAASTDDNSISVFDVIGQDYWGEGVTAKRIAGALRAMNGADVTVNVNSPGGDMFEGLAIYNLLREYEGRVTVKVLGIAASAASIIAMAGDDIQIGRGAFLMIHNCWVYAMGNRHDFAELAQRFYNTAYFWRINPLDLRRTAISEFLTLESEAVRINEEIKHG